MLKVTSTSELCELESTESEVTKFPYHKVLKAGSIITRGILSFSSKSVVLSRSLDGFQSL
jgi:hypothetical protein